MGHDSSGGSVHKHDLEAGLSAPAGAPEQSAVLVSAEIAGVTLTGDDKSNILSGGEGDDTLVGLGGPDLLRGNGGADTLDGGDGNDLIDGGAGDDTLIGGAGADVFMFDLSLSEAAPSEGQVIVGTVQDDLLEGDAGDDVLSGDNSNDTLFGRGGADTIDGGNGTDRIVGGAGDDTLGGGNGPDTFVVDAASGDDVVTDFTVETDRIVIQLVGEPVDSGVTAQSGHHNPHGLAALSLPEGVTIGEDGEGNAVISGYGGSLTLLGVSVAEAQSADIGFELVDAIDTDAGAAGESSGGHGDDVIQDFVIGEDLIALGNGDGISFTDLSIADLSDGTGATVDTGAGTITVLGDGVSAATLTADCFSFV